MAWYSILPPYLTTFETWVVRIFFVLGLLTIGPWAFLIVFDFLLYIWRLATYKIPVIGGRARGREKPRAPSLSERPSGHRRAFSLRGVERESSGYGSRPGSRPVSRPGSSHNDKAMEAERFTNGDADLRRRYPKDSSG
ncbi:hypothetical protein DTO166G4_4642 [Paecilomyces variotii]|nr:hypothetical protein DTO164E3_7686 [Paecilomyces variotii]KAJ9205743.1 hypothetical protein DTO032I3_2299 [Paecilomyces variotii]KAJ9213711.1 hypothetical protein DTO166G4_4642 [Paecilomyces variotii]KAJ9226645.1 hypothetical protein DTO169C6_885 [Paecilomyces variotii]KAJ9238151.1 hypothetical protein DTO166G5_3053 [Paecilomyces variotii]